MKLKQNKLGTYLAVTAGVGCAASVAEGAVTFYGINSANDTNPDPAGIKIGGQVGSFFNAYDGFMNSPRFRIGNGSYFTDGSDLNATSQGSYGRYFLQGYLVNGAVSGGGNYANVSFDGDDGMFESVAQFNFDGMGEGFLIAIASNADGSALSISDGKALIDAASVPEPSSLALLALGVTGVAMRRRRKQLN